MINKYYYKVYYLLIPVNKRVVKKCRNKKCKQSFGVVKLLKDQRAKCPFCGFLNKLNQKQCKNFN